MAVMEQFDIDIDELILKKIKENGGNEGHFAKIYKLITEYALRSGMPEDGIALIVLDCIDGSFSPEDIKKQLLVYDSKAVCRNVR